MDNSSGGNDNGVRMIEFFSGIGGMRLGVERALQDISIRPRRNGEDGEQESSEQKQSPLASCHAYEISLHANASYKFNFHTETKSKSACRNSSKPNNFTVTTKLIEQLKPAQIDGKADLWTMSPPCQPFSTTTNAKRLDGEDKRTAGLRHVMTLLDAINDKPRWIMLENVKGFVGSQMLAHCYDCLDRNGYGFREYLLSPMQFGIPNHRNRYYLIAERGKRFFVDGICTRGNILDNLPCDDGDNTIRNPLSDFVQHNFTPEEEAKYLVSDDILEKPWARGLPIVSAKEKLSHCFTAAYGRVIHQATGSLLLKDLDHPAVEDSPINRENMLAYSGSLRRFTPKELLALFGYPKDFDFPSDISLEHQYKLIGNSVNVFVVSKVAKELLSTKQLGRIDDTEDFKLFTNKCAY